MVNRLYELIMAMDLKEIESLIKEALTDATVEIQDLAGKFVRQHFILANEGTNLVSFETSELSKGMYLLKISSASGAKTVQFIVN